MHFFITDTDFKQPANRQTIIEEKGLRHLRFIGANQIHSDIVRIVDNDSPDIIDNCDALVTSTPGIAIYILTADCVPVLLSDEKNRVVAAVHAGWKGTAARIAEKTIDVMINSFGSSPSDIQAYIGPHIHAENFEVGYEVVKQIGEEFVYGTSNNGKPLVSLTEANVSQLSNLGVPRSRITIDERCTYTSTLPSWRREMTNSRIGSCIFV